MKLAVQQSLLPGDGLSEKLQLAADYGFEGVELMQRRYRRFGASSSAGRRCLRESHL